MSEGGLYFEMVSSIEEDTSWHSLVLDLLNLQSIFFGLTVLKLLNTISALMKS